MGLVTSPSTELTGDPARVVDAGVSGDSPVASTGRIPGGSEPRLPWPALLTLASIAFLALVSELLPAGLLTPMADDLGVTESQAGLFVTVYALAAGVAAIPIIGATRSWSRHRLMLIVVGGFAVVNLGTAFAPSYAVMLPIRVAGGVVTGMMWSLVGGYAAAVVGPEQRGRALAIALGGATVAFSTGLPASSALGALVGWRAAFGVLAGLGAAFFLLATRVLPHVPGEDAGDRLPFWQVVRLPGIAAIGGVTVLMIVGHNVLYTYVDPFVERAGLHNGVSAGLLLFGAGSIGGMWVAGRVIDRDLRRLLFGELWTIAAVMAVLGVFGTSAVVVLLAFAAWGVAYGGLAAVMQTASVRIAGPAADVAVSVTVTAWSLGIAGGALVGGIAFDAGGAGVLPWVAAALVLAAVAGVAGAARHGFPRRVG
jgi:predicted MFS family arabinose efflux permease